MRKLLRSPLIKTVAHWANKPPVIWDGVYDSFDQAPVSSDGFTSDAWLDDMERYTRAAVMDLRNDGAQVPQNVPQYHALFSILVASLPSLNGPVRVLDFGGGMGIGFANLMRCVNEETRVEYLVVDNEQSCERGRQLLRGFPSVKFMSSLPDDIGPLDVVVLSGVLQFVEDYEELLTRLARFQPSLWLFTFVPAGEIPTFASAQLNVPGSVLPVWFFNLGELVKKLEALGYRLIFKSALDRVFDMSNFPLTHRLPRQCNLLFGRR